MSENPRDLLTPPALASELGVTAERLKAWRYEGKGPAYVKVGRFVRYRRRDVDAWLSANAVKPQSAA